MTPGKRIVGGPSRLLLVVLLALLLTLYTTAPLAEAATIQSGMYVTTTAALNLRAGPSTGDPVLRVIPVNTAVYVRSGPHNSVWYGAVYSGAFGYVHGGYLAAGSISSIRPGTYATTTTSLNLRAGPSTSHPVLALIPASTPVPVQSGPHNSVWFNVAYQGTTGYVHGGYLANRAVVIRRVTTSQPYVAITVDDFYTADYAWRTAPRMLRAANDARAALTLCPAGGALVSYDRNAPDQAAEIKQLVANGSYELCNHTYSHPVMPDLDQAAQFGEITRGAQAIINFFGRPPSPLVRPPYGRWAVSTQEAATLTGYPRLILWSIDTGDAVGAEKTPQQLVASVAGARPGDIILMHANRRSSADALPLIIASLRDRGLEPVTLNTLLTSGQPVFQTVPAVASLSPLEAAGPRLHHDHVEVGANPAPG